MNGARLRVHNFHAYTRPQTFREGSLVIEVEQNLLHTRDADLRAHFSKHFGSVRATPIRPISAKLNLAIASEDLSISNSAREQTQGIEDPRPRDAMARSVTSFE